MADGAGAWRIPRGYRKGMVVPPEHTARVTAGVKALQWLLDQQGYQPGYIDGIFADRMDVATRAFQRNVGLVADGIIGPKTGKSLALHWIWFCQWFFSIPNDYLAGIVRRESGYDPAAQGSLSPDDYGYTQINTLVHPYTMEQAIEPGFCIPWTGLHLRLAYQSYGNRWEPAIAQHNSPKQAKQWFETGQPPSDQIRLYVEDVMRGATK